MKNYKQNQFVHLVILPALFIIFIVLPGIDLHSIGLSSLIQLQDMTKEMFFGMLHPASLLFIGLSYAVLLWTVSSKKEHFLSRKVPIQKQYEECITLFSIDDGKVKSLEDIFKHRDKNGLLLTLFTVIKHGASEDEIQYTINKRTAQVTNNYETRKSGFDYISTVLPILGMIGTIAGLLQMFAVPDGNASSAVDDFSKKFEGLRLALATTLYAALITVLLVKPKSREKESKIHTLYALDEELVLTVKIFIHHLDYELLREYLEEHDDQEVMEQTVDPTTEELSNDPETSF